jgi:DNA uptake protein ComE-like DNA-binding protein
MKHISFESLKEWFGYTRRERRASFILLLLIAAVAGIRFIIPGPNMTVEILPLTPHLYVPDSIPGREGTADYQNNQSVRSGQAIKLLDLNSSDSASLEALPGIGPVLSARIIKYRKLLGGFASVSQLREVYGLPEETFTRISGMLVADSANVKKININNADFKQLIKLPYFEKYEVTAILKYRELQGRLNGIDDLVGNKLISDETAIKVRPYLEF